MSTVTSGFVTMDEARTQIADELETLLMFEGGVPDGTKERVAKRFIRAVRDGLDPFDQRVHALRMSELRAGNPAPHTE